MVTRSQALGGLTILNILAIIAAITCVAILYLGYQMKIQSKVLTGAFIYLIVFLILDKGALLYSSIVHGSFHGQKLKWFPEI